MSKRRRRAGLDEPSAPEALTGVARLLSEGPVAALDLHGMTADQAERRVRDFVITHWRVSGGQVVHIVTGKGTRSEGRAVLFDLTRDLLSGDLVSYVDEWAGLPGGGGWAVRVGGR